MARIDYLGISVFVAFTKLLPYDLATGGTAHPWKSASVLAPLVIGFFGLGVFIVGPMEGFQGADDTYSDIFQSNNEYRVLWRFHTWAGIVGIRLLLNHICLLLPSSLSLRRLTITQFLGAPVPTPLLHRPIEFS